MNINKPIAIKIHNYILNNNDNNNKYNFKRSRSQLSYCIDIDFENSTDTVRNENFTNIMRNRNVKSVDVIQQNENIIQQDGNLNKKLKRSKYIKL